MTTWLIEPHDPLILRDGKPFNPTPGAKAASLPFPLPSTLVGALRTRAGSNDQGMFDSSTVDQLLNYYIRGPLLAEVEITNDARFYAAAPADALITVGIDRKKKRTALSPRTIQVAEYTDLEGLPMLVAPTEHIPEKADSEAPRFWHWRHMESWLLRADADPMPADLGIGGLPSDQRVHVRVSSASQAADEGGLFVTRGLEFTLAAKDSDTTPLQLALILDTNAPLRPGLDTLGGERRIVAWQLAKGSLPEPPAALINTIVETQRCRVLLLTPALFKAGYQPEYLLNEADGVTPELIAAAVGRPQIATGWDYEKKQAKPSRRMAPAGSVYWLRLNGTAAAIRAWAEAHWMQNISDEQQDRNDGFGLAVLGVWQKEA